MRERLRFERELKDLELERQVSHPDTGTPSKTPIIFIPGVMGSELTRGNTTVWPTTDNATAMSLQLDENGRDIGDPISPTTVIRRMQLNRILHIKFYEGFFTYFRGKGYELGTNLIEFPYDWRKDLEASSILLGGLVQDVRERTKHDKVILIAHSLGGLVARGFMINSSIHKYVEKFIILGTPHHGAPKYLSMLLFGREWPFPWWLPGSLAPKLSEDETRRLVRNFASIYQGTLDSTSPFHMIFNNKEPVKPETLNSLHPGQYNESMIQRSINFHEALNRSWERFPFYNTFLLVSLGVKTINAIHMKNGQFDRNVFDSPVKGLGSGDETIPGFSSTQLESGKRHNHVDAPLNTVKHQDLANDTIVLNRVLGIINTRINKFAIPVWELRNKKQEEGSGPLMAGDSRRDTVFQLQTALVSLGYNVGSVDGIFGPVTKGEVEKFQKEHTDFKSKGLIDDGIVGPLTADSINRRLKAALIRSEDYFTPKILDIFYGRLQEGIAISLQPLPGKSLPLF